jgi:hypothetical protein
VVTLICGSRIGQSRRATGATSARRERNKMARFVHIDYPVQHGGVTRVTRGLEALRSFNLVRGGLHALAVIGAPVTRALTTWAAARKQRADDEKLWNLALTDARIMADLSRAMSQDALRDVRGYY